MFLSWLKKSKAFVEYEANGLGNGRSKVVGTTVQVFLSVACLHKDGVHAGIPTALDIEILVTDHEGAFEINAVIHSSLEDHAWGRFTAW